MYVCIYNVYIVFSVGRHQSLLEAPGATSIQTGSPVLRACARGGNGVQNWQVPVWWINCSFSFHHGWSMQLLSHLEFGRFPTKGLARPYVLHRPRVRSRAVLCAKQPQWFLLTPSEPPATSSKRNRMLCTPGFAQRWQLGILTIWQVPFPSSPAEFLLLELVLL